MVRLGPVSSSSGRKPGTPTIGTATEGNSQATVTFTAPTYLGKPDSPLTYTAISSPSSISNTGSGSPITVTGLSNGTAYTFTVKLNNTVLDSDLSSATNSVTPAAPGPSFPPSFGPSFPPDFGGGPSFPPPPPPCPQYTYQYIPNDPRCGSTGVEFCADGSGYTFIGCTSS